MNKYDLIAAWIMTATALLAIFGAIFDHNWKAAWFAFAAAWFAWSVAFKSYACMGSRTKTEREACAKVCAEIAMKHQQEEGTYAAGKKAGAFECAETLRSNV
jgi:hypothetical protein